MYHKNESMLIPTAYFGENCYGILVEACKYKDIYVYDNADMVSSEHLFNSSEQFTDYKTGKVVQFKNMGGFYYTAFRE